MPPALCWSCSKTIDSTDNYCRYCGYGQGGYIPWHYHPVGLVLLTFLAMGPFVLPFVWKSPKLSRQGKWIATGLVALFTFWLFAKVMEMVTTLQTTLAGAL